MACSAGLVGAPLVGPLAGATLATAGVIDLALGWRKVIADTRKAHADSRLLEMDIRVKQLELQAKELELEKAKLLSETETSFDPHLGVFRHSRDEVPWPPESAAVPRRLVRSTADKLKMNETYANHLLNRCLPKLRLLKQKLAGSSITCQMWNEQ